MRKSIKILLAMMVSIMLIGTFTGCQEKQTTCENGTCETSKTDQTSKSTKTSIGDFTAKDFDGNEVNKEILKGKKVSVLNFWFNGCSACVNEMPGLEKFSKELEKHNSQLIGVNMDSATNDDILKEAKEILKKQGVSFKNIGFTGGKNAMEFLNGLMAFPTTILVDENGNIIGEEICGNIDSEDTMNKILKQIDEYKAE